MSQCYIIANYLDELANNPVFFLLCQPFTADSFF